MYYYYYYSLLEMMDLKLIETNFPKVMISHSRVAIVCLTP